MIITIIEIRVRNKQFHEVCKSAVGMRKREREREREVSAIL